MKKYVLYDGIIDINQTLPLVTSAKELLKFIDLELPTLQNAPRDIGNGSIGIGDEEFYTLNAKTLSLAAKEDSAIVCVEDSSFLSLILTKRELKSNQILRDKVEVNLAKEGIELNFRVKIDTLDQFITKEYGVSKIKKALKNSFDKFYGALYLGSYQCQIARYSDINSYANLLDKIDLKLVNYNLKEQVSGYEILDVNEELSYKMAGGLMLDMFDNAADFIIVNDARSFVMFDEYQKNIEKTVGREINLPVFSLAQILLLAFGVTDRDKLGLNDHKIKTNLI